MIIARLTLPAVRGQFLRLLHHKVKKDSLPTSVGRLSVGQIPSVSLSIMPAAASFGISNQVWKNLINAVRQLENTLRENYPLAKIDRIFVNDCSLTRGMMVQGSDIDDMYIGVQGIDDSNELEKLAAQFAQWIATPGLSLEGANSCPQVVSIRDLAEKEKKFVATGKHIITIYENEIFKSRADILNNIHLPSAGQPDKFIARIKLLLLLGEIPQEHASILQSKCAQLQKKVPAYNDLASAIEAQDELKLGDEAIAVAFALQKLADHPIKAYDVAAEESAMFETGLFELCCKGLVYIFGGKVIPIWRAHSPRWSAKFWSSQITITESGRLTLIERVEQKWRGTRPNTLFAQRDNMEVIEALGSQSIFDSARALEIISQRPADFAQPAISVLQNLLKDEQVNVIYSRPGLICHYLLSFLPKIVLSAPPEANGIAEFIYAEILTKDKAEFLVYSAIGAIGQIMPYLTDSTLKHKIMQRLQEATKGEIEWIMRLAAKTIATTELLTRLTTNTLSEVGALLSRPPSVVVYNKGIVRIRLEGDSLIQQADLGSVPRSIFDFLKLTNGGIVVCSALTGQERLIADSGRLVRMGSNVWLKYIAHAENDFELFYNRFANPFLWLLHHGMVDKLRGAAKDFDPPMIPAFQNYEIINQGFANVLLEIISQINGCRVFFHDYHLYLVPGTMRKINPDWQSSHFVHIPFPKLQDWQAALPGELCQKILSGLLGNNVVAFHIQEYADNFMQACAQMLGAKVNFGERAIIYQRRKTFVQVNPISIEVGEERVAAQDPAVLQKIIHLRGKLTGTIIGRYERTDLTKGIPEGFMAFREMLRRAPSLIGQISMFCALEPHRQSLPAYYELMTEIDALVTSINRTYSPNIPWNGLIHSPEEERHYNTQPWPILVVDLTPRKTLFATAMVSDVLLVNPLIDGMNLVVKLFAVLNDPSFLSDTNAKLTRTFPCDPTLIQPAVLIASKNMGAYSAVNRGALAVDPYDISGTADVLYRAVTMPLAERSRLATIAAQQVTSWIRADWLKAMLEGLAT